MSEEQKRLIDETVANMKQMDRESLLILKGSAEVLKARDEMDRVTDTQDDGQEQETWEVSEVIEKYSAELIVSISIWICAIVMIIVMQRIAPEEKTYKIWAILDAVTITVLMCYNAIQ